MKLIEPDMCIKNCNLFINLFIFKSFIHIVSRSVVRPKRSKKCMHVVDSSLLLFFSYSTTSTRPVSVLLFYLSVLSIDRTRRVRAL